MRIHTVSGRMIVLSALGLVALVIAAGGIRKAVTGHPPVFSKENMLASLWFHYKEENLEPSTERTLDKSRGNITTSEGESYALLRAVWMDDRPTFDASWNWTKDNLVQEQSHLMSWLFGKQADGTYGILTAEGGEHSASDADTDAALALLFASKRWDDNTYFGDAVGLIRDIWSKEVAVIGGKPYLLADDAEKSDPTKAYYLVDPSYFAPYAYRIFAQVDPTHDWLGLVDTSYEVINENMSEPLDKPRSDSMPSDWLALNKRTAAISAVPDGSTLSTDFGYDALRVPWRLALDREWFAEPRASVTLSEMGFLQGEWSSKGLIDTRFAHDGSVVEPEETAAMYGGTIGYFMATDPTLASAIYQTKLEALYNPDTFNWKTLFDYYDANWAWFGLALYNHLLPNLYSPALYPASSASSTSQ